MVFFKSLNKIMGKKKEDYKRKRRRADAESVFQQKVGTIRYRPEDRITRISLTRVAGSELMAGERNGRQKNKMGNGGF